ncbi:response regulator [Clostridium sp. MCC353]|uniref:LytR/AlgR family response regulator transcription factor n=1 Tax=Clostridium sp. MCC353 TaxID=2592646 RepID=UPI001C032CC1|nr:LytTR family DNA-binding domain-containing protein [Clostridium sp. MCC353]MBT9775644.1 response regulator [Clostridium sp. MCC353]
MKIAVIDDERPARRELIHQILEHVPDSDIMEADSGAGALELLSAQSFDLLFIDINLNDMEGTTLAAAAQKMMPKAQIVFATAYSQYAVKAFELGVSNYILKPFDPERVKRVLEKCRKEMEAPRTPLLQSDKLAINTNKKILLVDIHQIVYLETEGRGCIIHTAAGDYTDNQLLGEFEKKLASHSFYRIHKSYLVNLNYISELFPWANNSLAVKMQGFEQNILPVSRDKVKNLRQLLGV